MAFLLAQARFNGTFGPPLVSECVMSAVKCTKTTNIKNRPLPLGGQLISFITHCKFCSHNSGVLVAHA